MNLCDRCGSELLLNRLTGPISQRAESHILFHYGREELLLSDWPMHVAIEFRKLFPETHMV